MKKKILVIAITILCLGGIIFTFTRVKADSGWDSNYDSGSWSSDYGGGSDWGSSWDSDYSGNYSSNGSITSSDAIVELAVILIILIIVAISSKNNKNNNWNSITNNIYSDVSDELLKKYGINKEDFKQMIYNKYVDIQNAWMNFDYDILKDNLTNELYNSYLMQLEILKTKKQQNIMSNYEKVDAKIINITEENNLINVKTYLRVCMYDYVVDEKNKVVRGTKKQKIDIEYIIDWVREKNIDKIEKCPHCGAEIKAITSGVCEYCRAKVILPAKDYVMSRKMGIGQRRK